MEKINESLVYPKAGRSFDAIHRAIEMFLDYLKDKVGTAEYYKARNYLRDGEKFYKETLENAKKLMGPIPAYATADYEKWRKDLLEKSHVLAKSREFNELKNELQADEFLSRWMEMEEINVFLNAHFHTQQKGNRKLEHIKARMIIDKLRMVLKQAKQLKAQSLVKQQSQI
jgi:hypothetical protein